MDTSVETQSTEEVVVSIIIPTKNGAALLSNALEMIFAQSFPKPFEVIIIDSGSVDNTLDIARRFPAHLIEISPEDFGHGRTRNLGARLAKGKYLVFTTQDAIPATDKWLYNLVRNLEYPKVAGAYGRQNPRDDTNPIEKYFLNTLYPSHRSVQSEKQGLMNYQAIFFSNVNSAIKREVLERYPFPEDIIMSEDQEWARRVLRSGYEIVYDPEAAVYHSHNYRPITVFQRYFDSGASLGMMVTEEYSFGKFITNGLKHFSKEVIFLLSHGYIKWIPYAILYDFCKFAAILLGKNERYIPSSIQRRLSAHKRLLT